MLDQDGRQPAVEPLPPPAPGAARRTWLRRILEERPEARPRLRSAVVSLLATILVAIVTIGILLIWHLRRRGRIIRDRLGPPRDVCLYDPSEDFDENDLRENRPE